MATVIIKINLFDSRKIVGRGHEFALITLGALECKTYILIHSFSNKGVGDQDECIKSHAIKIFLI